jgi:hypothetical protein
MIDIISPQKYLSITAGGDLMEKTHWCFAFTTCFLGAFSLLAAAPAYAQSAIVGVNLVNAPYYLTPTEQETILGAMQDAGVRLIRASIPNDDKGIDFAQRVYAHGIRIE